MGEMNIENTIGKYEDELLNLPNVIGVGVGEKEGEPTIIIFVTHKVPESSLQPDEIVPKKLGNFATDVEEIGVVTSQDS